VDKHTSARLNCEVPERAHWFSPSHYTMSFRYDTLTVVAQVIPLDKMALVKVSYPSLHYIIKIGCVLLAEHTHKILGNYFTFTQIRPLTFTLPAPQVS
jgi:hypothetical protein